jgi:hypothetical protein
VASLLQKVASEIENTEKMVKCIKPVVCHYVKDMLEFMSQHNHYHLIRPDSIQGCFKIAKALPFNAQNQANISLTTDGTYLYLIMTNFLKGAMLKIGTGENGTIPGKVYLYAPTEKESEIAWVYCKGKLYLRRANDEVFSFYIILKA